jgi:putative heme-binding domain-containing protein
VWLLANLGAAGVARVEQLVSGDDANLRIAAYRALRSIDRAAPFAARLAGDPSPAVRREVALSLRDVPFDVAGPLLLELAKGYDGKDRSYLEAWGIGATGKEEALYSALIARQPGADAATWPAAYADLVWRLTPRDAVPAFTARAQAASLPASERAKAVTALGLLPTRAAANALLDVAQQGGKDFKTNPALWWLINYKDSRWADAGVDAELKRRGLFDPDVVEISEVTVPAPPATSSLPPIADIVKLRGNARRGATAAAACQMCHRVGGKGVDYAPALDGFASRQTKDVVITAIVNPSNDIAHGYDGTEITLADGRKIHGLVLSGGNPVVVQNTGGVTQLIPAKMIKERKRLGRSLMLSADQLGLSAQQVADIAEYLK